MTNHSLILALEVSVNFYFHLMMKLHSNFLWQPFVRLIGKMATKFALCPGTKCEGCLRKPKHTKEQIKKDSKRCFAKKKNSENSELKPALR